MPIQQNRRQRVLNQADRPTRREFLKTALGAGAVAGPVSIAGMPGVTGPRGQSVTTRRQLRWHSHSVARIPHGYQLAVADVNGDGKPDILALSNQESIVEWYENPTWKAHAITDSTKRNISMAPFRLERRAALSGHGLLGLVLATDFSLDRSTEGGNLWWGEPTVFSPISGWVFRGFGRIPTSHRLRWGDIDGDGRLELVDAPILGAGARPPSYDVGAPLTWFTPPQALFQDSHYVERKEPPLWDQHLIDDSLTVVHGIHVLDWDGDGRDEILTASFEGVHLFHSTGQGQDLHWAKTHLASGDQDAKTASAGGGSRGGRRGSSEISVGKLGGRRFLATIEPWHGEQVAVYLEGRLGALWTGHIIDSSFRDGHALACGDLDADGNDEVVAGFRGPGTSLYVYYAADPFGTNWERQILDTEMAASGVAIADINGDGRLDVIAIGASTGNVKWYENLGLG